MSGDVDSYAVRRPKNASIETWRQKKQKKNDLNIRQHKSLNGEENRRKQWKNMAIGSNNDRNISLNKSWITGTARKT